MNWFVDDPLITILKFMSLFYANGISDSFGNGVYYPRKDIQFPQDKVFRGATNKNSHAKHKILLFAFTQFSRKLISLKVRDLLLWTPPAIMVY